MHGRVIDVHDTSSGRLVYVLQKVQVFRRQNAILRH
jgi:hypothetical protein